MSQIMRLWSHLEKIRKRQFILILILMIFSSFAEVISIGAVLPFLGVLTAPEKVFEFALLQPLINVLDLTMPGELILPITIIFILAVILAGAIRLTLIYAMTRFSYTAGADLSIKIYRNTLYQDYDVHISRNTSEVIDGIINKTSIVIGEVISPVLTFISAFILLIGVMSALLAVDTMIAFSGLVIFGLLYYIILIYVRRRLSFNSKLIAKNSTNKIKSLQEGLGGIRDVLIDGNQEFYCNLFQNSDLPLRRAAGDNSFISASPRFIMEALGMTLIALLAYTMSKSNYGIEAVIPILGTMALGAQRMLPSLQQVYATISTIKGAKSSCDDVLELLDQPLPDYENHQSVIPIQFNREISLKNINFRYSEKSAWIFDNINLKLDKGSRIGFIGATGVGKSTMLDIIMGLLKPTKGVLQIDGVDITRENYRNWQAHIAHVPQSIYLADCSIKENIAFGVLNENIDFERVKQAAKFAQLSGLIDSWEDKYNTHVGERGVRLSGGQRQRIGVARALYKKSDVLIFDEATSALDFETENAMMNEIETMDNSLTIFIIAHRLTTLKSCNQIIKINADGHISIGDYNEFAIT